MSEILTFLTEQNRLTLPLFIVSIISSLFAINGIYKSIDNPRLYLTLSMILSINLMLNITYLSQGLLYNICPIFTSISCFMLCHALQRNKKI